MPIPRIIQQMWVGNQSIRPARLMQTWQDKNPSCVYMLWTEENLKDFTFRNQKQIDDMSELNGKCDIMRYELLSKYGGIFFDADMECVNTLDDFFFENTRFTGYENEQVGFDLDTKSMLLLSSASIGFEPNDPLCNLCILELGKIDMVGKHGWQVCGNEFLATVSEKWKNQFPMKIYPSWYFLPKHGTGLEYKGTDKIYAKHYWGSTFGIYGTL